MVVLVTALVIGAFAIYLGYRQIRHVEEYVESLYLTGEDWFE